jgi:hypothetical protein
VFADRRPAVALLYLVVGIGVHVVGLLLALVEGSLGRWERLGEEALGAHKVAHVVVRLREPERVVGVACC